MKISWNIYPHFSDVVAKASSLLVHAWSYLLISVKMQTGYVTFTTICIYSPFAKKMQTIWGYLVMILIQSIQGCGNFLAIVSSMKADIKLYVQLNIKNIKKLYHKEIVEYYPCKTIKDGHISL